MRNRCYTACGRCDRAVAGVLLRVKLHITTLLHMHMTELILTSNRPYKFILFLTKAVFYITWVFLRIRGVFVKKKATESPKPHFITLEDGVRGVLIENTTESKIRGVFDVR